MDELSSTSTEWRLRRRVRARTGRMRRRPWRNGASWTPEEAAHELRRRRQELVGQLRRRSEARGVPAAAQEEIVDDAITAVVMSSHIKNERHLLGADRKSTRLNSSHLGI